MSRLDDEPPPSRARERRVDHEREAMLAFQAEELLFLADEMLATWALDPGAGPLRCPLHHGMTETFDGDDLAHRAACPVCFLSRAGARFTGCKPRPGVHGGGDNHIRRGTATMAKTATAEKLGVQEIGAMLGVTVTDAAAKRLHSGQHQAVIGIGVRLLAERDGLVRTLGLPDDALAAELATIARLHALLEAESVTTQRLRAEEEERDRPRREKALADGQAAYLVMCESRQDDMAVTSF